MNKNFQDPGQWRSSHHQRPWYQKAFKLLPKSKHQPVLELGSGAGEFADSLTAFNFKLTCTDNSPTYLKQLKAKGYKVKKLDLNQKLPFRAKSFSGIISLEVIEHLTHVEQLLSESYRVLKPKGWLVLSTPNIAWWGYRLFMLLGNPPKKEGYHFRFFTYQTLSKALQKAGFKIIDHNHFTTIPFLNRLLLLLKQKPIYPTIKIWPNFLAQDLVFLCQK